MGSGVYIDDSEMLKKQKEKEKDIMTKEAIFEKLGELATNPDFEAAMVAAETKEASVEVLKKYGWDISLKEFEEDVLPAVVAIAGENGELSEESLDNVAGGIGPVIAIGGVLVAAWMIKGFVNGMKC